MTDDISTCRICRHQDKEHRCTHPSTSGKDGEPVLSRLVWFVAYRPGAVSCMGRLFEDKP